MKCVVPECCTPTADKKYLMCFIHWNMIPIVLQKTIWRLYNNGKPLPGHADACESAVQQVLDKLDGGVLDPATSWPNRTRRITP